MICCVVSSLILIPASLGMLITYQEVYAMIDNFIWNKEEQGVVSSESEKSLTFSVMKREDNEKRWKEALYYSWFLKAFRNEENEFDGMLDRKGITYYQDQIISSLGKQGERYDVKRVVN